MSYNEGEKEENYRNLMNSGEAEENFGNPIHYTMKKSKYKETTKSTTSWTTTKSTTTSTTSWTATKSSTTSWSWRKRWRSYYIGRLLQLQLLPLLQAQCCTAISSACFNPTIFVYIQICCMLWGQSGYLVLSIREGRYEGITTHFVTLYAPRQCGFSSKQGKSNVRQNW